MSQRHSLYCSRWSPSSSSPHRSFQTDGRDRECQNIRILAKRNHFHIQSLTSHLLTQRNQFILKQISWEFSHKDLTTSLRRWSIPVRRWATIPPLTILLKNTTSIKEQQYGKNFIGISFWWFYLSQLISGLLGERPKSRLFLRARQPVPTSLLIGFHWVWLTASCESGKLGVLTAKKNIAQVSVLMFYSLKRAWMGFSLPSSYCLVSCCQLLCFLLCKVSLRGCKKCYIKHKYYDDYF